MADANTFVTGVVLPRAIGLPADESLRIGAISAAAGGGNLQQTSLLSALLARRRKRELDQAKTPPDGDGGVIGPKEDEGEKPDEILKDFFPDADDNEAGLDKTIAGFAAFKSGQPASRTDDGRETKGGSKSQQQQAKGPDK